MKVETEGNPAPGDSPLSETFRALFDEHADYVVKSLLRLGVRAGDAEDVMHEVFVAVLRRGDSYDASRPMRPWLFGFALRMASTYRQSAYVRRTRFEEPEGRDDTNAEQLLSLHQESILVHRALDALDDDKRVVLVMFELDERSAIDIAEELQIPQNTVFSRLRAARAEFAVAVKRLSAPGLRSSAHPVGVTP